MSKAFRPQLLSDGEIESIHYASTRILENVGVKVYNDAALKLLDDGGVEVDFSKKIARIPQYLVKDALAKAPSSIKLYSRDRKYDRTLEGDSVTFNPGSSALYILDYKNGEIRKPVSKDLAELVRLVNTLKHIHAQSTALVVSDVPQPIVDRYRLYIVLKNSLKPIVTGAFSIDGLYDMKKMLEVIVGGKKELAQKPLAVFDVCPSAPLKWSELDAQNLIDLARFRIPAEIIPVPQLGATGPVTIAGSLVQHNAEFLSGLVMTQLANPGAPVIYGGSPTVLDQRYATACLGAIEAMMLGCAYSQIAKFYRLPSHMYIGLSDAKIIDAQCGFESGIGIVLGTLSGINVISGPGMLNFENCQSLEKLVIDNEICGIALRLSKGITVEDETLATNLIEKVGPGGTYLAERHTLEWVRKEQFIPSEIIDRKEWKAWKASGSKDIVKRAHEIVENALKTHESELLPRDIQRDLEKVMEDIMKRNIKILSS